AAGSLLCHHANALDWKRWLPQIGVWSGPCHQTDPGEHEDFRAQPYIPRESSRNALRQKHERLDELVCLDPEPECSESARARIRGPLADGFPGDLRVEYVGPAPAFRRVLVSG